VKGKIKTYCHEIMLNWTELNPSALDVEASSQPGLSESQATEEQLFFLGFCSFNSYLAPVMRDLIFA
jgi:hypothetical protein